MTSVLAAMASFFQDLQNPNVGSSNKGHLDVFPRPKQWRLKVVVCRLFGAVSGGFGWSGQLREEIQEPSNRWQEMGTLSGGATAA